MSEPTVEEILARWSEQSGWRVTESEREFIRQMRMLREVGVGYGWMRQVIGREWTHHDPAGAITDDVVARLAANEMRERCAKACDVIERACHIEFPPQADGADMCSLRIRAMPDKETP